MIKKILKWIIPHGLIESRRRRFIKSLPESKPVENDMRNSFHEERRKRIREAIAIESKRSDAQLNPLDYEMLIDFLENRGIPRFHLIEGSIPSTSLAYLDKVIRERLHGDKPIYAVHVGNFVGVSLTFLSGILTSINSKSRVVGIDPNLTHRGISNPQFHVAALVTACALQNNVLLLAGYSSKKSISNDGVVFEGYDPTKQLASEFGCENCIESLSQIAPNKFDIILMDGNHEAEYLQAEILQASKLLKSGGLVVLDDVDSSWQELKAVFERIENLGFQTIGTDGRIGIAHKITVN
jgi:hypothetical protein